METVTPPVKTKKEQKINLIDGCFTASEAADIINSVLQVKINFHKLQRLSRTEGFSGDACEYDNGRINELIKAQQKAKDFFNEIRKEGGKLQINSIINISKKS